MLVVFSAFHYVQVHLRGQHYSKPGGTLRGEEQGSDKWGFGPFWKNFSQRLKFLEHGTEDRENIVEPVPWVSTLANDTVPMVTAGQKEGSKAGFAG